ncbi:GL26509 [Drosophila persimilis]|uniref:GL26509 n=1 Tax=Drosophila persimilis TaxID=7234 RepID=B4GSD9_DROPE|nr:GL26510 [Drosophila persimilis]EDW25300.1 GL26509 [Drosophila persimilis]
MDTQLKAEILPDSPEQALVKEMKRVELQLQNLDRKTLKNKNENVAQHQPASPRWSRITPTFKCFTPGLVFRGATRVSARSIFGSGSIHMELIPKLRDEMREELKVKIKERGTKPQII